LLLLVLLLALQQLQEQQTVAVLHKRPGLECQQP
jgi:hypothetical protein